MTNNTSDTRHYSLTAVESAIEMTEALCEGAQEMLSCYNVCRQAVAEGRIPLEEQFISEMELVLTVLNRMTCKQEAELKHYRSVALARKKADEILRQFNADVPAPGSNPYGLDLSNKGHSSKHV